MPIFPRLPDSSMPSHNTRLLLILLTLGAALHLFRLGEPRQVVFDEVHFGGFVSAYCGSGEYFFDIHPPHAKLLIAGTAALGGYRGDQPFEKLGEPYTRVSPALLRLVPALAGALIPVVLFGLMLQLGASPMAAFLAGLAALFDNSLLVQTRIIALDGVLLLSILGALSCSLAASRSADRLRRTGFALLAGVLAGLAVGSKFTGLVALGLIGLCIAVAFLRRPSWKRLRLAASHTVWVLSGALAVYAGGWYLHFALLTEPGYGYAFGTPTKDFLFDAVKLHRVMFGVNYGLAAPHPDSSPWWGWPLMLGPVFYWSGSKASLYFLGNPVVWWGSTLGLVVVATNLVLLRATDFELRHAEKLWPARLWIPLAGYLMAFLPLVLVPRVLFLYHYLTPLLFALCVVILWLDHVGWTRAGSWARQRWSFHAVMAALVVGFLVMSPFTFAFLHAEEYQRSVLDLISR
jgi:dolichyl-phosphate-mannose-protein mannosyltransferase